MHRPFAMVREAVRQLPLPLANLTDPRLVELANSYLPYSVGLEIESSLKPSFDILNLEQRDKVFKTYESNMLDVQLYSGEHRYRVKPGIEGLISLYNLSQFLQDHAIFNTGSGIHYHIDCTEYPEWFKDTEIIRWIKRQFWILTSLKSWNYTGNYNCWIIACTKDAVRIHIDYNTIEFRIGEMTFDYTLLAKRIIHAENIVRKLKDLYIKEFKN